MYSRSLSGSGIRGIIHPVQLISADKYQCYDFGEKENMLKYGQKDPPDIPIEQIEGIPIAFLVGVKDRFTNVLDARSVRDIMNNTVVFYREYDLAHTSFAIAKNMSYMDDVVELLRNYAPPRSE